MNPKLFLFVISVLILINSCKKNNNGNYVSGVTSLNIVNAVNRSTDIIVNINNQLPYYIGQVSIFSNSSQLYRFSGGNTTIAVRQSTDTSNNLLAVSIPLENNTVNSLFLTGTVDATDTLLVKDDLPVHNADIHGMLDSSVGVRFVNLSPGSAAVSINILGKANGSEVSNLAYKGITDFINYSARSNVSDYTFEFRDQATGDLLATYELDGVNNGSNGNQDLNTVRFKNLTIVFWGVVGSQATFLVNNY